MSEWLVGKKAVANELGVSVSTVGRYLNRYPDFPAHRRGGTIFVSPAALVAWIEHREIENAPDLRDGHPKGNQMTRIEGVMKVDPGVTSPLFSVAEAAIYLGMSKDWVYERLKALIPHVKIGGALKFRKEDMDRYIASQTIAPMNVRDVKSPANLRELMREPRIQNGHKNR